MGGDYQRLKLQRQASTSAIVQVFPGETCLPWMPNKRREGEAPRPPEISTSVNRYHADFGQTKVGNARVSLSLGDPPNFNVSP